MDVLTIIIGLGWIIYGQYKRMFVGGYDAGVGSTTTGCGLIAAVILIGGPMHIHFATFPAQREAAQATLDSSRSVYLSEYERAMIQDRIMEINQDIAVAKVLNKYFPLIVPNEVLDIEPVE